MGQEVGKLYMHSITLMDKVEELQIYGGDEKQINLLERAANLGNVAILYFKSLSREELERIDSVLLLSEKTITKKEPYEENSHLESIIDSLEELFREKKMLLGETKSHIVA